MIIEYQFIDPDYIATIHQEPGDDLDPTWRVAHMTLNLADIGIHYIISSTRDGQPYRWLASLRSDELLLVEHCKAENRPRAALILRARAGDLEVIRCDGSYLKAGKPVEMSSVKPVRIRKAKMVSPAGPRPRKQKDEDFDD